MHTQWRVIFTRKNFAFDFFLGVAFSWSSLGKFCGLGDPFVV